MEATSTSLRISLVQTSLHWESPAANCAQLEEELNGLIGQTDLVILPEMFSTGFSINTNAAEIMQGASMKWMLLMAQRLNALLIGSLKIKEGNQYFNRCIAAFPDGTFDYYDKKHLFRMAKEEAVYTPGTQQKILIYKGFKIALFVCYDLRFPVWIRNQGNAYDLAVFVANWPAARAAAWRTLLRARAIENLCYVAGVNIVGTDGNEIAYQGDSALVNFKGEAILDLPDSKTIQTASIHHQDLLNFRESFPAYLDADGFTFE